MSPLFLLRPRAVAGRLTLLLLMLPGFLQVSGRAHAQSAAYTVFELPGAGDGIQVPAGSRFFRAVTTVERAASTTLARSSARRAPRRASMPFSGARTAAFTILVHSRVIPRAPPWELTAPVTWLAIRKEQLACARFCGRRPAECRIWACWRGGTAAALLMLTPLALWLARPQVPLAIEPLYGSHRLG